jgi:hypothetical protein
VLWGYRIALAFALLTVFLPWRTDMPAGWRPGDYPIRLDLGITKIAGILTLLPLVGGLVLGFLYPHRLNTALGGWCFWVAPWRLCCCVFSASICLI